MKHGLIYSMAAAAALLLAGCSKNTEEGVAGYGRITLDCETDIAFATRAQTVTVPATSDMSVSITGADYQKSWSSMAKYEAESPLLKEGDYTVVIGYGQPNQEGVERPYYTGSAPATVVARQTVPVSVTVRIANSLTTIEATEQFRKYFPKAEFTLGTASGNSFRFASDATGSGILPLGELVYVKVGTSLTVSGSAHRQSQTGVDEGPAVEFQEQTLQTTEEKTCHRFRFDAPDAGSATLDILIDDTVVETIALPIELNDEA